MLITFSPHFRCAMANHTNVIRIQLFPEEHNDILCPDLWQCYKDGLFTDYTLNVGGRQIKCHRNVLYSAIPYFKALFSSGTKDAGADELELELEADGVELAIEFCYSGEVEIPLQKLKSVILVADYFQLCKLKSECDQNMAHMVQNFAEKSDLYEFAKLYSLSNTLRKLEDDYIWNVSQTETFTSLLFEELRRVFCRLRKLGIDVIQACIKWLEHDWENRKGQVEEVVKIFGVAQARDIDKVEQQSPAAVEFIKHLKKESKPVEEKERNHEMKKVVIGDFCEKPGCREDDCAIECRFWSCTSWEESELARNVKAHIPWGKRNIFKGFRACTVPAGLVISGGYLDIEDLKASLCSND